MKPFYVDIEDLTYEEVVEIYDRAIANGAVHREGIDSRSDYEYFAVEDESNCTWFLYDYNIYNTGNKLTLQQVREQYPLPSDKTTTLSPRDLACFYQVAEVIGEEDAEIELAKVLACDHEEIGLKGHEKLCAAFYWHLTPQQDNFWCDIDGGEAPVTSTTDISTESDTNTQVEGEIVPQSITAVLTDGYDMVKKPNHYQLFPEYNLEVKDVNKRILDKMAESGFDITLYEASWFTQSMQYFERCYAKNGLEDLEKGVQTMQFVIDSMKERLNNDK